MKYSVFLVLVATHLSMYGMQDQPREYDADREEEYRATAVETRMERKQTKALHRALCCCYATGTAVTLASLTGMAVGGYYLYEKLSGGVGQMENACHRMEDECILMNNSCTTASYQLAQMAPTIDEINQFLAYALGMLKNCPTSMNGLKLAAEAAVFTCCDTR